MLTTRGRTSNEDASRIDIPGTNGIRDHVRDRVGVSSPVVGERSLGGDVPACARVRRAGVDDNESVLICELGVRRTGEVARTGDRTLVEGDDESGIRSDSRRLVDVETDIRRVGETGGDLLERRSQPLLNAGAGGEAGERCEEECEEAGEEIHVWC